jgi:hypothetical protein
VSFNGANKEAPNHHCEPTPGPLPPDVIYPDACLGEYPHIGADKYGFYVTWFPDSSAAVEPRKNSVPPLSKSYAVSGATAGQTVKPTGPRFFFSSIVSAMCTIGTFVAFSASADVEKTYDERVRVLRRRVQQRSDLRSVHVVSSS